MHTDGSLLAPSPGFMSLCPPSQLSLLPVAATSGKAIAVPAHHAVMQYLSVDGAQFVQQLEKALYKKDRENVWEGRSIGHN